MLLQSYEDRSLLCNVSINGATSTTNLYAFRGDLVIEEGDIADNLGRRKPPKSVVKQAVILLSEDKIVGITGALHELAMLETFSERYNGDIDPALPVLFYVENLSRPLQVNWAGLHYILIPHDDGAVWNTLMDDLRLDKDDFKGQSAEDKVITMFDTIKTFQPKYDTVTLDEAESFTLTIKKDARGPV